MNFVLMRKSGVVFITPLPSKLEICQHRARKIIFGTRAEGKALENITNCAHYLTFALTLGLKIVFKIT